jgi:acetylornithine/succinyldiaminopimelate/putrescine aminotransferase
MYSGEGGISGISEEFVKAVRELKQKYNFLLLLMNSNWHWKNR